MKYLTELTFSFAWVVLLHPHTMEQFLSVWSWLLAPQPVPQGLYPPPGHVSQPGRHLQLNTRLLILTWKGNKPPFFGAFLKNNYVTRIHEFKTRLSIVSITKKDIWTSCELTDVLITRQYIRWQHLSVVLLSSSVNRFQSNAKISILTANTAMRYSSNQGALKKYTYKQQMQW